MRNFTDRIYRQPLSSLLLLSLIATSSGMSSAISATPPDGDHSEGSRRLIAQTSFIGSLASFWQLTPRRRRLVSRTTGICAISPGLIDTYFVWSDHPLFLWNNQGKTETAKLVVREEDTGNEVWTQNVNLADQKVFYKGKTLEPGKRYQWQLLGKDNLNETPLTTFQIMDASQRNKIQTALDTLEQNAKAEKASKEDIAQRKADYFAKYNISHTTEKGAFHPWSDALEVLYRVDQPSPAFVAKRQAKAESLCK